MLRLLYKISQGKDVETYIASNVNFIFKFMTSWGHLFPNRSLEPLR